MTLDEFIKTAIDEDVGDGDHTSLACIPEDAVGRARLLVKQEGIMAGLGVAKRIFELIDDRIKLNMLIEDGTEIKYGDEAFYVEGPSRSILMAERLSLNIMQRMSGIATYTGKLVKLIEGTNTRILDTRKTTPNFRYFEKLAVKLGGGDNHRMGLYDRIMIKDNHIDFAGGIQKAILKVNEYLKCKELNIPVEIEARNLQEIKQILEVGKIDRILIDNFTPEQTVEAVLLINNKFETESSGGIDESNIRSYAETGVDFISIGALTHQIKSLDLSLKAY